MDRLKTATATCANDPDRIYNQGYFYDLAGNMTEKTGIGGWDVLSWEDPDKHIRPASVRFDAEIAGIGQRNILYNQDQKPSQITYNGGTTNLTYDGAGERIKKVKDGETVIYVGGIYEIRDGQAMSLIFANGQKIVTLAGTKEYYSHSDHLGSTSIVTDESGSVVEEIGYLPFGATLFRNEYNGSTWGSAYRFTGQEFDEEYHLYNYNARLYDPIMSRFITPDTIISQPFNPQSLNRYSYALNNPLRYTDPSGHKEEDLEDIDLEDIMSSEDYEDFMEYVKEHEAELISSGKLPYDWKFRMLYGWFSTFEGPIDPEFEIQFLLNNNREPYHSPLLNAKPFRISDLPGFLMGNEPREIFTFGIAVSLETVPPILLPVGGAISWDRVVMLDGKVDWFFTYGVGGVISSSFISLSIDRGRIYDGPLSKQAYLGESVSGNVDLGAIGVEAFEGNYHHGEENRIHGVKAGLRNGVGINVLYNNTIDW